MPVYFLRLHHRKDTVNLNVQEPLYLPARPVHRHGINLIRFPNAEVGVQHVLPHEARTADDLADLRLAPGRHLDLRAQTVRPARPAFQMYPQPVIPFSALIPE